MTYSLVRGTEDSLVDNLNGAILLGPFASSGVDNLGGRTLIFSSVPQTITFPGGAGATVTVPDIIATLATVPGLRYAIREAAMQQGTGNAVRKMTAIAIWHADGLVLSSAGTANALLRLSTSSDTTSTGPVPAERVRGISPGGSNGTYVVLLSE
jgi:hypothetical protein